MFEYLENLDRAVFLYLNGIHNDFWDGIMYWISGKTSWIPWYIFLLYMLWRIDKKKMLYQVLSIALVVALCDQISVQLFKNVFERYRPCHNEELINLVHLVKDHCGGQYGFVSSHATNTFGLATFLGIQFLSRYRWLTITLFCWAAVVSYSRIYLGVHYPSDVIGGTLLGITIGFVVNFLMKLAIKRFDKSES